MVVWIILFILTIVISVVIASFVLPNAYLKASYALKKTGDRGIKKIAEKNDGTTIVYEPVVKWRKYVKQYLLSERYGQKKMVCKIDPDVEYLAYDVVLFNHRDEPFDVISVKEKTEGEFTKPLDLPEETSYVALSITEVDTVQFPVPITQKVPGRNIVAFLLWCSLCLFMEVFCVKACCSNLFGGVFRQSFMLDGESFAVTLVIALVTLFINLAVALPVILIRGAKKTKWNK